MNFNVSDARYPAPDWSVQLQLRGPAAIDVNGAAEGDVHRFAITAAATAAWLPGSYWYRLVATRAGEVHIIEEGDLRITADLAAAGPGFDGRSHARRVLDAIEAVIEDRATRDQQSYKINNRSLERTPIADLLKLRSFYRSEVAREDAARKGRRPGRLHKVRF